MEYLIGWGLLLGFTALIWLVIRLAGGEREEPRASCGVHGHASKSETAGPR